jgi:hypothetical protein
MDDSHERVVWCNRGICPLPSVYRLDYDVLKITKCSIAFVSGVTGLIGKFLKYVSPLTIVPTVALVGLTLFHNAAEAASKDWGIAAG